MKFMFFSFFIFTQLDIAEPRRRTCVQPILFNIFSRLAWRLSPMSRVKMTSLRNKARRRWLCLLAHRMIFAMRLSAASAADCRGQ